MNQTDTNSRSESDAETGSGVTGRGRKLVSTATPYLRRGVESGAVTGMIGGMSLLSGFRTFLGGQHKRGVVRLAVGGAFLAATIAQRRSRKESVEGTDGIESGSDVETFTDGIPDLSSDESVVEEDAESGKSPQIDRLGEAAFDRQSREVPVPQRAFNQGFLAHSSEAFWGIHGRDDAVLVSQDFDAIQGRDGVEYVASSEIGGDVREVPIPTAVLAHWDEVSGGGTAITGGDDILFVTTDGLKVEHLLRVLPSEWAEDLSE